MAEDPTHAFDTYKKLFLEHVCDMERNETGNTPKLSHIGVRFIGRSDCDEGGREERFPYTELVYEISFDSDTRFYSKTILAIEKWVDVSSCRLVSHDSSTDTYLFEIKLLQRDQGQG